MSKPMSKEQAEFQPSDELVEEVGQGLANLTGGKTEVDDEEDSTPEDSQISQAESEAESESQLEIESEVEADDDSTPEDSQISQAESEAESDNDLPENYYRAAIHQGWKPEDIASFVKSNPELAKKTFEKIYESTNKLSQQFAAAGRQHFKSKQKSSKPADVPQKDFIDVKALREKYGDEEPAVGIAEAINAGFKELLSANNNVADEDVPKSSGGYSSEDVALAQVVENFFVSDEMKPFAEYYGKLDSLNTLQDMHRFQVLEMADNIIAGADLHGQEIKTVDALTMAHLAVTESMREQMIRKNILATAKKRQKGLNFRPNKNKPAPKKAKTEKEKETELIKKTQGRLGKLFGSKKQ